jgi:hypothetical protein
LISLRVYLRSWAGPEGGCSGTFPKDQVSQVIRGEANAETHSLQDMPVWGPVFRSLNSSQEPVVRMRVANLTRYIESLQVK